MAVFPKENTEAPLLRGKNPRQSEDEDVPRSYLPQTGLLSYLPLEAIPYAELMRVQKPAGYYTFLFPHLTGLLWASLVNKEPQKLTALLRDVLIFSLGSILLRGAGCTWNDILDAPYDRLVARCKTRPLARGAIDVKTALAFTAVQSVIGALILLGFLPLSCTIYAVPLVVLIAIYPTAKRITNYPQALLGVALSLGQLVGAAAAGFDLRRLDPRLFLTEAWGIAICCFFAANVISAAVVDTVYAHQDLADDLKIGLKSTAVAWGRSCTKPILAFAAALEVAALVAAGGMLQLGAGYHIIASGGTAATLAAMLLAVKLEKSESCYNWFQRTIIGCGLALIGGLGWEYGLRVKLP